MPHRHAHALLAGLTVVLLAGCGEAGSPGADGQRPAAGEAGAVGGTGTDRRVSAEARLEARGQRVSVGVTLAGLTPDLRYPVYVHEGSCAEAGPVRLPLGRVTAGTDGSGSVRMTIDPERLPAGPLSVEVQDPNNALAACADVARDAR